MSEKGFGLVDEAARAHVANQAEVVAGLSATEKAQLSALLAKLIRCSR